MFVLNSNDQIEYVAAITDAVHQELEKLFSAIETLQSKEFNFFEVFYFASLIHLVFVKIHPFQDSNGRSARLIEKWFLLEKLGEKANSIQQENNYFNNLKQTMSDLKLRHTRTMIKMCAKFRTESQF